MNGNYSREMADKQAAASYGVRGEGNNFAAQDSGRQSEIPHQMEKLTRTIAGCRELIDQLNMRLEQSVMRCEPPSPVVTGGAKDVNSVQATSLGSQLQSITSGTAEMCARVQSMLQRLEV